MYWATMEERSILLIRGTEGIPFLQKLLTQDLTCLHAHQSLFTALLTPQGKIFCDMILSPTPDGILLDCHVSFRSQLLEKLHLYKLRADVHVEPAPEGSSVLIVWKENGLPVLPKNTGSLTFFPDPRSPKLGHRAVLLATQVSPPLSALEGACTESSSDSWHLHRVSHRIAEAGIDFASAMLFPHEANMDLLHGLSFHKGCYVGQEVVARMQHRNAVRKRIHLITWEGTAPESGQTVLAGKNPVGKICSSYPNGKGFAVLHLERIAEALSQNIPLHAAESLLTSPLRYIKEGVLHTEPPL